MGVLLETLLSVEDWKSDASLTNRKSQEMTRKQNKTGKAVRNLELLYTYVFHAIYYTLVRNFASDFRTTYQWFS